MMAIGSQSPPQGGSKPNDAFCIAPKPLVKFAVVLRPNAEPNQSRPLALSLNP